MTALDIAYDSSHVEIARCLVDQENADVHAKDNVCINNRS
jgi:hypothetical protein